MAYMRSRNLWSGTIVAALQGTPTGAHLPTRPTMYTLAQAIRLSGSGLHTVVCDRAAAILCSGVYWLARDCSDTVVTTLYIHTKVHATSSRVADVIQVYGYSDVCARGDFQGPFAVGRLTGDRTATLGQRLCCHTGPTPPCLAIHRRHQRAVRQWSLRQRPEKAPSGPDALSDACLARGLVHISDM